MLDGLGREIDYMRISITDRCNLRCRYCMPEVLERIPHERILRYEEILRVCKIASGLGIGKFRITGGEPLVRAGAADFLIRLRALPTVRALGLTTNGILLPGQIDAIARAKPDAVNISLDTLLPKRYRQITGFDALGQVLAGIRAALDRGLCVRINCVLMRGVNDDEVEALAALAEKAPVDVRFIELMPLGAAKRFEPLPGSEVLMRLLAVYPDLHPGDPRGNGPARYHESSRLQGRIGLIDPLSACFCGSCNRVRLSSEGFLRLCLDRPDGLDLRAMLRGGADDRAIGAAVSRAIQDKPAGHQFGKGAAGEPNGLSGIGG